MELLLLRHGQTAGNLRRAYIGSTDEPLCDEGVCSAQKCAIALEGCGFVPDRVFASPLLRAIETARICFPSLDPSVVSDLREMDFGAFEGKNYLDMQDDPQYNEWVEGMCEGPCPNGECKQDFIDRTCKAFRQVIAQAQCEGLGRVAIVAHGGTLMAVLSEFVDSEKSYYDWHAKNCEGYLARVVCPDVNVVVFGLSSDVNGAAFGFSSDAGAKLSDDAEGGFRLEEVERFPG